MGNVEAVSLHETTRERYLNYALSVITSRALPDVRDGLKPVQRRILYGMHLLRLSPDARFRKSAQVVGEVMGKYHPHGDSAIYEAMVRMAQTFSLRYTLVDGHGNFGSLDGDGAAAMRYTEARLAPIAVELLADLSPEIVPFRPSYDGSNHEPIILPAAFPNLLVNGATGIAVGMATNIPPHNLREVIDACVALIDDPQTPLEQLVARMPAPDFPTGGRILNTADELLSIYETGQGAVEMRGEYHVEREGRRCHVVVDSVPYMVNKAQLIERIADHIRTGRLPQVVDVRDESTEDVRVVLELKGTTDPDTVMAYVFKHTPLQSRFHVNLTCLVPTENEQVARPERIGLTAMLRYFLDFRFEVVTHRLEKRLAELERAIHILEGFEIIFDALDEAIAIIRASRDRGEARIGLMERFGLDEEQTDAILDMRLYRLAALEVEKIRSELAAKRSEASHIETLLASAERLWGLVKDELLAVQKRFGDPRKSTLGGPDLALSYSKEDYILDEDVYVIVTKGGWFKRQRSYSDLSTIRVRDGDAVQWAMLGSTRECVVLFSDVGKAYTMLIDSVPATTGHGEPVQAHFDFEDGERIIAAFVTDSRCLPVLVQGAGEKPQAVLPFGAEEADLPQEPAEPVAVEELKHHIVAVSRAGQILRLPFELFAPPSTVAGRLYMRLQGERKGGDCVVNVGVSGGAEWVSLLSYESRALVFPVSQVGALKSAGKGLRAMSLDRGDHIVGFVLTDDVREGVLAETNRGRQVHVTAKRFPPVTRASRGKLLVRRGNIAQVFTDVVEIKPAPTAEDGKGDGGEENDDAGHEEGTFEHEPRSTSASSDASPRDDADELEQDGDDEPTDDLDDEPTDDLDDDGDDDRDDPTDNRDDPTDDRDDLDDDTDDDLDDDLDDDDTDDDAD